MNKERILGHTLPHSNDEGVEHIVYILQEKIDIILSHSYHSKTYKVSIENTQLFLFILHDEFSSHDSLHEY